MIDYSPLHQNSCRPSTVPSVTAIGSSQLKTTPAHAIMAFPATKRHPLPLQPQSYELPLK
jgi:hypothetical protein